MRLGEIIEAEVINATEKPTNKAVRYFHKLRDLYAGELGYSREYAKNELCLLYGPGYPFDEIPDPPPSWLGVVAEIWGKKFFRKSLLLYTKSEMTILIDQTIRALAENGIDIDGVMYDYPR